MVKKSKRGINNEHGALVQRSSAHEVLDERGAALIIAMLGLLVAGIIAFALVVWLASFSAQTARQKVIGDEYGALTAATDKAIRHLREEIADPLTGAQGHVWKNQGLGEGEFHDFNGTTSFIYIVPDAKGNNVTVRVDIYDE